MSSAVMFYLRLKRRPFAKLHPEFRNFIPNGPIFVTGPKGHDMLVEFLTFRKRAYLGAGWIQFLERNGISYGDILLCRFSPQIRTMAVDVCSQSADTEMFSSKIYPNLSEARRSEPRNDYADEEKHSKKDPGKDRKQKKDLQQFIRSLSNRGFKVTLVQSRIASACVSAAIIFALLFFRFGRGSKLIPAAYVHYMPEEGGKLTLIGPDGYKSKTRRSMRNASISRGWYAFRNRYRLKVGDEMVFEILSPSLWKVHIFS